MNEATKFDLVLALETLECFYSRLESGVMKCGQEQANSWKKIQTLLVLLDGASDYQPKQKGR